MESQLNHVVSTYRQLLQRGQQSFESLKDIPAWGPKSFEVFYRKTFETFIALWRFQQDNRTILERPEGYNLQRFEVGELASKMAQLFYYQYLRTSELTALNEAFVFYEAIRARQYFRTNSSHPNAVSMMRKKMRYYARFVVVALLQDRRELVRSLTKELTQLVELYNQVAPEGPSWASTIRELQAFLQADRIAWLDDGVPHTTPMRRPHAPVGCSYRLHPSLCLAEAHRYWFKGREARVPLKLTYGVLCSNKRLQVKFSELSLDVLRMAQFLEWDPGRAPAVVPFHPPGAPDGSGTPSDQAKRRGELSVEQLMEWDSAPRPEGSGPPSDQVKISDLSIDSLRMAQLMEWDPGRAPSVPFAPGTAADVSDCDQFSGPQSPPDDVLEGRRSRASSTASSTSTLSTGLVSGRRRSGVGRDTNPRKALLYRPGYSEFLSVMSCAADREGADPSAEACLVFLSGNPSDGLQGQGLRLGGAASSPAPATTWVQPSTPIVNTATTTTTTTTVPEATKGSAGPLSVQASPPISVRPVTLTAPEGPSLLAASPPERPRTPPPCPISPHTPDPSQVDAVYWLDLLPFTRRPMFVIVDSENSKCFQPPSNVFGQPLICLLSPRVLPAAFTDPTQQGSLFTLFLTQPILAFWFVMGKELGPPVFASATVRLLTCLGEEVLPLLAHVHDLDPSVVAFLSNDWTRILLLRFLFCQAVFQRMPCFPSTEEHHPSSFPALPPAILEHKCFNRLIADLRHMAEAGS